MDTIYTDSLQYMTFLEQLQEEQNEMKDYVNECIILSNPNKRQAISELAVFNEAKVGEKMKSLILKLKSFFSKIFQKFIEKLTAWSESNKSYLEKYKDIIIGKKVTLRSASMQDHFTGYSRITNVFNKTTTFAVPPDSSKLAEHHKADIEKSTKDSDAEKDSSDIKEFTISEQKAVLGILGISDNDIIDEETTENFAVNLTAYFNGGKDSEEFTDLESKMKNMFNTVYQYEDTFNSLTKLKDAYSNGMDKYEKNFELAYNDLMKDLEKSRKAEAEGKDNDAKTASDSSAEKLKKYKENLEKETKKATAATQSSGSSTAATQSSGGSTAATQSSGGSTAQTGVNSSYTYSSVYGKMINEADIQSGSDSSNSNTKNSGVITADNSGNKVDSSGAKNAADSQKKKIDNSTSTVKSNMTSSKTNAGSKAAGAVAADAAGKQEEADLNRFRDYCIAKIRVFSTTRTQIFGSILNALTTTRNDYMDVIRAHVQSYIGKVDDTGDNTGLTSTGSST